MSTHRDSATIKTWLAEPVPADVAQSLDRLARSVDVQQVAVMPDVHLAGDVCVGVVVATRRLLYPSAVGGDIGCGMAALRFAADASLLDDEVAAAHVLRGLYRRVPALKLGREQVPAALPGGLSDVPLSAPKLEKLKHRDGRFQFGTLGRGNHFLELQADQDDRLWLMVHSGSRALGQAITTHHLDRAAAQCGRDQGDRRQLVAVAAESAEGQAYLADVDWATAYARESRLAMVSQVCALLAELFGVKAVPESLIHADHNHVRREVHFGEPLWVHRKGALSAAEGEAGVIPGSMGSASYHVSGRGNSDSLRSSSHGAGRALRRGEAAQRIDARRLERELSGVWFDHRKTAHLCDEAPSAYKDIRTVMRAQRELTRIDRELRPLLSYKG